MTDARQADSVQREADEPTLISRAIDAAREALGWAGTTQDRRKALDLLSAARKAIDQSTRQAAPEAPASEQQGHWEPMGKFAERFVPEAPTAATDQPSGGQVDERVLFEQEANAARFFPRELDFSLTKSPSGRDEYANSHLQSRWEGWQAGRASLTPTAPQAAVTDERRNIDQWTRTSDMGLTIRFFSARACSAFERYLAAPQAASQPELAVWYGPMPESNGKSNFTAILKRKGAGPFDTCHVTIDRSEYPDRVRYEADRVRWIIGELADEPDILAYDADKHSGYVAPQAATTASTGEAPDKAAFEAQARYQGATDFEPSGIGMVCENGWFPATYRDPMTELAWRVWANKPALTPVPASEAAHG